MTMHYILDIKCSHRKKKKWLLCDMTQVLVNALVVITLPYISVSNQRACTLNLCNVICQLYLDKAGKKITKRKTDFEIATLDFYQL